MPVDQQTDDDLRVDPAFLGVADLAQGIFLSGFDLSWTSAADFGVSAMYRG